MVLAAGESVTLHTRSSTALDSLGVEVPVWTDTTIVGCAFDPGGSIELVQGQDMLTSQPTLYLPAGSDVEAVDQITVRGDRYDVDGSPNAYTNPYTGRTPGVVAKLKAVTG